MHRCARLAVWAVCFGWTWAMAFAQTPPAPSVPNSTRTADLLRAGAAPLRVVCLGDSVTGVYYHTGGRRAYPEMLQIGIQKLFPNTLIEVINAGISGNTTLDALNRLDTDVLAHKPHLVTVMFGLNDMKRVPLSEFEANLTAILEKCRAAGAEVILCTPNPITETESRTTAILVEYTAAIRRVAERALAPVADCYAALEACRAADAFQWLLLMSDEIHPNMMGHKRMAETIAMVMAGQNISLENEGPPKPALPRTMALLKQGKPVRVYAMPPYDGFVRSVLEAGLPNAQVEVTPWAVGGLSLAQIEENAKQVRDLKPDLVIMAVPLEAKADTLEQFVRAYKRTLNAALSFGHQEWDCIAVVPSVTTPPVDPGGHERDRMARTLIWAQDIALLERGPGDARSPETIFAAWMDQELQGDLTGAMSVGERAQLFMDTKFIAASANISLRMNPPVKAGTILVPDKPWESGEIGFCVSAVQYEGEYKLWYLARDKANHYCQCYARSRDGITWEKPELGLIEYQGAKNNNIVLAGAVETTVFLDPAAPPEQRFKALSAMYWPDPEKAGLYVWNSPDGIHFVQAPVRVFPLLPDTANQAFYDTRLNKYVANIRVWAPLRKIGRVEMNDILAPWPFTPLEKPYYIWGEDKIPVPSREVPIVFAYDEKDPPQSDHYNAACIQYPWADDAYFMFPTLYRHFPEPPAGKHANDGLCDIQMAVSRDGVHWKRPSREPYVPLGREGDLDAQQLYMAIGVVRNGDALFQYYGGYKSTHGQTGVEWGGSIQRLEQRLDGFICAYAPEEGGTLSTPPIVFSGRRLLLNIDGSAAGTGKAALLDAGGNEIPGFAFADCASFDANWLACEVTWKGKPDLSAWAGKPIRLAFELKSMKLFAFRFAQ